MLAAFGLAACGGGGGGTAMDKAPPPDTKMMPDDTVVSEDIAAATKAAATKLTAIGVEAGQDSDLGLGGTDAAPTGGQVAGEYNLAIKHGETSITVEGATAPADDKFVEAMDFEDGRTMHTRTADADADGDVVQEIAIVYTDIDAPKATLFATVHANDLTVNPKTTGLGDFQSVSIGSGNFAMVATTGITSIGAGPITVPSAVEDNAGTMDVDETVAAFETDATFNGAPGKLKCAGDNPCTVTLDPAGKITEFGNGWEFTPAVGATVDVADKDYLHYGFWLQKTTDADGADTYTEVQTFAGSSVDQSTDVSAVTGTAEYNGGAVGVYVKNVYNPDRTIASATSGHFQAKASLMAYFTGNDVAQSKQNTITGTINQFVLQHGEENEWSVALKGTIATNAFSGEANGGGEEGSFSGTFRGLNDEYDHDDDTETGPIRRQPSSVVGEFDANFNDGTVAGGFGARK